MTQALFFLIPFLFLVTIPLSQTKSFENQLGNGDDCDREEDSFSTQQTLVCLSTECVDRNTGRPDDQHNCVIYKSSPCEGFPYNNVVFYKCCNDSIPIISNDRVSAAPQAKGMVGGTPVKPGQFPYQVSFRLREFTYDRTLYIGDEQLCGGSIYNNEYVITAAQCVTRGLLNPESIFVLAGDQRLTRVDKGEQKVGVEKIIIHPSFTSNPYEKDIALVKLREPLNITEFVNPIRLPPAYHKPTGSAIVSGWGVSAQGNKYQTSNNLMYSTVYIISDQSRQILDKSLSNGRIIFAFNPCHHDSCQVELGGPMVCHDLEMSPYLCGIVSFREGCARPAGYSGIYTEVSQFTNWIEENTK